MQFTWQELIDRARVYVDDDTVGDSPSFLTPEAWLSIANVEYAQLRRRWVRMGLVSPAVTNTTFSAATVALTGVMAIVGVAEDLGGGRVRVLSSSQSESGRAPFWNTESTYPTSWEAAGDGDALTVTLRPGYSSGSYVVRYIPTVAYATDAAATIDLPYGTDERLVLGIARRSKLKEAGASSLLNGLIGDADAELNFTAFARMTGDGPRVRSVSRRQRGAAALEFPGDPSLWRYV